MSVPAQTKASISILKDDIPVAGAASSPDYLASLLEESGYSVRFVSAADLCSGEVMQKYNFQLLVLPYGASYPAMGRDALVSYLKGGGSFVSMGGYAFDNLLIRSDGGWETLPDDSEIRINTRNGDTRDSLGLHPDQIGVFDPSYLLKRVSYIEAAPGQFIFGSDLRIDGEFEGYAASSMTGSNSPVFPQRHGRWIPLLHARDAYGRLRGSAGAIVHNYAGPYAGSSWAYFGVTNRDLFAPDNAVTGRAFVRLVDNLIARKFITELTTEFACYRRGEEDVKILVSGPPDCDVSLEIYPDGSENPAFQSKKRLTGGKAEAVWSPEKFESDFYLVRARLLRGGRPVDAAETGFVVWDDDVIADGFPLEFSRNYFRAGGRAVFPSGTNQTGMMFASANENPLAWKQDMGKMSDNGVNILRVLHFSPFVVSHTGHPRAMPNDLNVDALPKKLERQLDAIVQLCQKYRVIFFLTLHDWMGVALSDEELEAQKKFAQVVAARYTDAPGIMYDVQNEPGVELSNQPDIQREFNDYLSRKYGTTENLRAAWRKNPPGNELGNIEISPGTEDWDDVKAMDVNYFKALIFNRWVKANADGVKAGDPGRPVTVGYLQWMRSADKILGSEHVDFSNAHFYGNPKDFARQLKLIDRRFDGKSFSLGEFGAKVHPSWRLGGSITTMEGGVDWFLRVGHYALGMGASFVANWDWKDMPDCVFPWGINHPCDVVPKDTLLAYRCQSMFFRDIEPAYEEPQLYFLVPDSHRLGGQFDRLTQAVMNGIDLLLSCNVDFGVINEYSLHKLPKSAKFVIYAVPFCPSDETYNLLRNFVRDGGNLCITGDISYNEDRTRTRTDRLEELCGVRYVAERYPNITGSDKPGACIQVESLTAEVRSKSGDGSPLITTNSFGKGRVFYCADPIDFHAKSPNVYGEFLDFAGVRRISLEPDDSTVRAFRLPSARDETVYVLFNESEVGKAVTLNTEAASIMLYLGSGKPGLIRTLSTGEVIALEAQGKAASGGEMLIDTDAHVMITALDGESMDRSKSLMLLPIESGQVKIATRKEWKNPIVGVGEIQSGKWQCLDRIKPEFSDGFLSFRINQLQSLNILLITESDWLDKLAENF